MRKGTIIVAVVIIVALVLVGFAQLLTLVPIDTKGVANKVDGIEGNCNDNGGGDLLWQSSYVTSWNGGSSETIGFQGQVRFYSFGPTYGGIKFGSNLASYYYTVIVQADPATNDYTINGMRGNSWTSQVYTSNGHAGNYVPWPLSSNDYKSWWPMAAQTAVISGGPVTGGVIVQFFGTVNWFSSGGFLMPPKGHQELVLLAEDMAFLKSGIGSVKMQNNVIQEGTNANFLVETGVSHSSAGSSTQNPFMPTVPPTGGGWDLKVTQSDTAATMFEKTVADNFGPATISWMVPNGTYKVGQSNAFVVTLRNELVDQDTTWGFVVGPGMLKLIPNLPKLTVTNSKDTWYAGDQVKVAISDTQNSLSTYNITGYWVWVAYKTSAGTVTNYVLEKAWYPCSSRGDGYKATVTFTYPQAGNVEFQADAMDDHSLNSGMSTLDWVVYKQQSASPPGPNNNGQWDYAALAIGIAAILIGLLVGIICLMYMPQPYGMVLGVIIIIAGLAVGAYEIYHFITEAQNAGLMLMQVTQGLKLLGLLH